MVAFPSQGDAPSKQPASLTPIIGGMVVREPRQCDQRPERQGVILAKPYPHSFIGTTESPFGLVEAFLSLVAVAAPLQQRSLDGDRQRSVPLPEVPQPSRVHHEEEQQRQR